MQLVTAVCVLVHLGFGLFVRQGLFYIVLVDPQLTVVQTASDYPPSASEMLGLKPHATTTGLMFSML